MFYHQDGMPLFDQRIKRSQQFLDIMKMQSCSWFVKNKQDMSLCSALAEERRQFYSEQSARVIAALAKLSLSEKRWADALRYAGEALAGDPFREDMHRLTMKAFAAQGKPASVKKHFERMKKTLHTELGIEPAEETKRLFSELMK